MPLCLVSADVAPPDDLPSWLAFSPSSLKAAEGGLLPSVGFWGGWLGVAGLRSISPAQAAAKLIRLLKAAMNSGEYPPGCAYCEVWYQKHAHTYTAYDDVQVTCEAKASACVCCMHSARDWSFNSLHAELHFDTWCAAARNRTSQHDAAFTPV